MATITKGASTITPWLILGHEFASESNNQIHKIIGATSPSVTLRPDTLRTGTLSLVFETRAAAWTAFGILSTAGVFVLVDPDNPQAGMSFVREGSMKIALDRATLRRWTLDVGFQQVAA